jgi:hypothetical protein
MERHMEQDQTMNKCSTPDSKVSQKRKSIIGGLLALTVTVGGCGGPKGAAFEGHWTAGDAKTPSSLDIKQDGGLYHVDYTHKTIFSDKPSSKKLEATAISDNVLSIAVGPASITMRLENGHLFFDDKEYTKAQ